MQYVRIREAACIGCGVCIDSCPTDVLAMNTERQKAVVAHAEDCQVCFLCEFDCPVEAIVVSPRAR